MTLAEFHNGIRILFNLDRHDLIEHGVIDTDASSWSRFHVDPVDWLIKADDQRADRLWALMQTRMRS